MIFLTELILLGLVSGITLYEVQKDLFMSKVYIRQEKPHKYDQLPQGTEILALNDKTIYTQINADSNNPIWNPTSRTRFEGQEKLRDEKPRSS